MSRISLVVAVYNVEDYLDACLESLTNQTFEDIEIICVNDGSTDESGAILDAWAARDGRILVVDKENGGPSSARNVGLDRVTSDYVCFPDADDRLLPDACETIVRKMDATGADVLTFGARLSEPEGTPDWLRDALSPRDITYEGFSPNILFAEASRPFAWRCGFRTELLRTGGVRFEESLRLGEDQAFLFAAYLRSKRTVFLARRLYEYRVSREGSLMSVHQGDLASKMLIHVHVVECILDDWGRVGTLGEHACEAVAFALDFALYDALKLDDGSYRKVAEGLREVLLRHWNEHELRALRLRRAYRRMLNACLVPTASRVARGTMVLEHYVAEHGALSALSRVLGSLAGRPA